MKPPCPKCGNKMREVWDFTMKWLVCPDCGYREKIEEKKDAIPN
jgi:DNA-directed RNA polymerase subunit M/transcription elongation factor TFIIS